MVITLTAAQISALECAGLDWESEPGPIERAWRTRGKFVFDESERESLFSAVNDASNSEDAAAQHVDDATMRRQANNAAKALGNLASKVLRAVNATETT